MRFFITLSLSKESEEITVNFDDNLDSDTISLNLYAPLNSNFEEILSKNNFLKLLKEELKREIETDPDVYNASITMINKLLNTDFDVLNNCGMVIFEYNEELEKYIDNNPILQHLDLFLDGEYMINSEDCRCVCDCVGKYNWIRLNIDGNEQAVTVSEYKKTVNAIEEIVSKIQKYDLSPLEQIMYAYDLVRDRVYLSEERNESSTISRDLSSVLFGDKIVCVGYANIFEKVLQNLGMNCMMYSIKNIDPAKHGHRRNIAYIKDDKYEVEGVFYFDPTWDSKKTPEDLSYLDSYEFFCKSKDEMDKYTKGKFIDRTFEGYEDGLMWEFEDIVLEQGIEKVPRKMIQTFNEIAEFIDNKKIINPLLTMNSKLIPDFIKESFDLESVIDTLSRYRSLFFDYDLDAETLLNILYNVRKIEYYEDPTKYPFTVELIKKAVISNQEKTFHEKHLESFGIKPKKLTDEEFEVHSKKMELEKNIQTIKLVKTLSKIVKK